MNTHSSNSSDAPAVVTRFAPSPTGFLHIGGARTALFNWLYARAHGGKMLLRIEDTDRARSTDEAIEAIVDGMKWLGLDWDGDPVSQFNQAERHADVVGELLDNGKAYRCFATREELTEMREKAQAEGKPPRYDGRWRDRDPSEAPDGAPFVVRIRAPKDGETIVDDRVQGIVRFPNKDLDDFILLRSDGSPTYMLAVVVDDHDMGVTHIIRGDDHLTNAARQTIVSNAMGWDVPVMSHIPLIHGPDGAKLSKRHGALGIEAYRAMGYLPEALRNYLLRLGWAHGDDEFFTTEEMISLFNLEGIGKSASRFDFTKLENMNGHYIRAAHDEHLVISIENILGEIEAGNFYLERMNEQRRAQLITAMPRLKERAKTLVELIDNARFLFADHPLAMDDKALNILDKNDRVGRDILEKLHPVLENLPKWDIETIETSVRKFSDQQGLKLGGVAQPLRAALTGRATSPGVFDVLAVLGKKICLERISQQMSS